MAMQTEHVCDTPFVNGEGAPTFVWSRDKRARVSYALSQKVAVYVRMIGLRRLPNAEDIEVSDNRAVCYNLE